MSQSETFEATARQTELLRRGGQCFCGAEGAAARLLRAGNEVKAVERATVRYEMESAECGVAGYEVKADRWKTAATEAAEREVRDKTSENYNQHRRRKHGQRSGGRKQGATTEGDNGELETIAEGDNAGPGNEERRKKNTKPNRHSFYDDT